MWYVYMLLCDNKQFYVGTTDNLPKRLKEHRERHSYFTKNYKDIQLVYQEWHSSKVSAEKHAKHIDGLSISEKRKLIGRG